MGAKQLKPGGRRKRPTAGQRRAWGEWRALSAAWNNLTEEQRRSWNEYAQKNRRGGQAALGRRSTGRRFFMRANSRRLALGQNLLSDPPGEDSFRPTPMVRLVIANDGGQISLKLHVSGGPTEGVMVSSWHPVSPGTMVWEKFVRIGPLPAAVGGISDITRLYVAKYGVPPVGKKVFIRIQQLNDYVGNFVQIVSAVVAAASRGGGKTKGAKTIAKP
jgi:hypothetical protein